MDQRPAAKRVMLLGATGTIGRATARALVAAGHDVTCVVRGAADLDGVTLRRADVTDPVALRAAFQGEGFDVLISCLAARDGSPDQAWAIDHQANVDAFTIAREHGVGHVILLSAICVQKPRLAFQHAKLAAEAALIASGLTYSIVRPTAFFKSLSGQIARVQAGKPFLLFGDGRLTACKPISDGDLGAYLAGCIDAPDRWNKVLPIGGPGPAITPVEQGAHLFALLGKPPQYKRAPVALMSAIVGVLGVASRLLPSLKNKAEFARIGHYYATESMLVWDEAAGRYDAAQTPETGRETLFDYYAQVIAGEATVERGEHSVF